MTEPNLKEFLIENKVYRQFCDNLGKSMIPKTFDEFVTEQKADRNESDGGLFAFTWAETPEGFYFWNRIDLLWQKYYQKVLQNIKV